MISQVSMRFGAWYNGLLPRIWKQGASYCSKEKYPVEEEDIILVH